MTTGLAVWCAGHGTRCGTGEATAMIGRCDACGQELELAYAGLAGGRAVAGLCLECYHAAGGPGARTALVWRALRRFAAAGPRAGRGEYFAPSVAADARRAGGEYAAAGRRIRLRRLRVPQADAR